VGIGLGAGLLIGARAGPEPLLLIALLFLLGLMLWLRVAPQTTTPVIVCLMAGGIAGGIVGMFRDSKPPQEVVFPESATIVVQIRSDPKVSGGGSTARSIWHDSEGHAHDLQLLLPVWPDVIRGDTVEVTGRKILTGAQPAFVVETAIAVSPASRLDRSRHAIRNHSADAMVRYVPGSAGSLTLGLLTGDDSGLSSRERQDLRASGLSHITAVSGWNVSIIVVTIGALFRAVGARAWYWLSLQLIVVGVYVWIVGLEPPIVRAAIMGAVGLTALHFGRPAHLYTHLILAAGIMATLNPDILESLSFQLSFLSMIGLAVAATLCAGIEGWKAVLIMPAVSALAATIATAPLLAATFGSLPLLSVPANLLAGQVVSWAAFAGMAVVGTTWLGPVAEIAGWIAWSLSSMILKIASGVARTPGAYYEFAPLSSGATLTIYAALGILAGPFFPETREAGRNLLAWAEVEQRSASLVAACLLAFLLVGVALI
jgi:competence protein ComEC